MTIHAHRSARYRGVDVRHVIEYQAEVVAGDLLEIHAGVTKIGTKSITVFYRMTNLGSNETAATLEAVCVLFDLEKRQAIALSDELRDKASKHLVQPQES